MKQTNLLTLYCLTLKKTPVTGFESYEIIEAEGYCDPDQFARLVVRDIKGNRGTSDKR